MVIGVLLTGEVTVPPPAVAPVPGVKPDEVLYSAINVPAQLVQVNGTVAVVEVVVIVPIVGAVGQGGVCVSEISSKLM